MTHSESASEIYKQWRAYPHLPSDIKAELDKIQGDQDAIESRFGATIDFGTGGLRGVMGAGLNRMNIYTVRRTTRALAEHVKAKGADAANRGVAIGYDCRHNSALFAKVAGLTLAAAGVKAYVSPILCPTPELSWSVRCLNAAAGIMITASHNPPEYNGYKAYNEHGGQLLEDDAHGIKRRMLEITDVFEIPTMEEDEAVQAGLYITTPAEVRAKYIEEVIQRVKDPRVQEADRANLQIVYTALHGTGNLPVREALAGAQYNDVFIVKAQAEPDGDFSTVESPNPEEPEALKMAVQAAEQMKADIVMGTDPDADRVGIAVRTEDGQMQLLTGNQVGALLVDYYVGRHKASGKSGRPIVFKTIVTSNFGETIAKDADIAVEDTLTGFKYIGDRITHYEKTGEYELLVGYEESYGYLVAPIVRDKDAVQTCLAIAEMAAYHKAAGKTLVDRLEELYAKHGFFAEKLMSVALDGDDGADRMHQALQALREQPLEAPGYQLVYVEDYFARKRHYTDSSRPDEDLTLPKSDVQKFVFEGGHWVAIRPSGTEPKMKVYVGVQAADRTKGEACLKDLVEATEKRVRV